MEYFFNKVDERNTANPERLFVYGSLMEGFFNYDKALKGYVISRIYGKVKGLLYHQIRKGYPAIVSGERWVSGEYLELRDFDERLFLCDKIEEYFGTNRPENYYERRICEVKFKNGETSLAWIYWYIRNDLNTIENPASLVPHGNWRNYIQNTKI